MEKENSKQQQTYEYQSDIFPDDEETPTDLTYPKTRIRLGLFMTVFGYFLFLLGARPGLFGLDRSRVIGFVQISVFLIGLAFMALGGYLTLNALWPEGKKTIAADIGSRLISTGYVISVFTAMADIFGLGSHPLPDVYFGPLQARGMEIGMVTIAVGFLLLIRYKRIKNHKAASKNTSKENKNDSTVSKAPEAPRLG